MWQQLFAYAQVQKQLAWGINSNIHHKMEKSFHTAEFRTPVLDRHKKNIPNSNHKK
jgi:hypothetical protein